MPSITAQELFGVEELAPGASLAGEELTRAFWQIRKMQREAQQQQAFWKSVNDSMSDAYAKLAASQEELKASREALQEANAGLEQKVEDRTAELREQLERIQAQQETIRTLVTPIIQVWDGILVLPIIGALDRARVADMTERLLEEVVRSSSDLVVLDLTGVEDVDAETADHLLKIHRAVGLLGARCLLSGLSPAVARAFTSIGLDLGGLVSFSDLRSALQYVRKVLTAPRGRPPERRG
jgi:anti-anti-sigma regulatory factor